MNIMTDNDCNKIMAESPIENNETDLVAFGVPFLANTDLIKQLENNYPLNTPNQRTFIVALKKVVLITLFIAIN
jgi:N-ethylmaleimide reductase